MRYYSSMANQTYWTAPSDSRARTILMTVVVIVGLSVGLVAHSKLLASAILGLLILALAVQRRSLIERSVLIAWLLLPVTAFTVFRSDTVNYPAYVMGFILIAGVTAFLVRDRGRPDTTVVFLGLVLLSAIVFQTGSFGHPDYPSLLMPMAALGLYLVMRGADGQLTVVALRLLLTLAAFEAVIALLQTAFGWPTFPDVATQLARSDRGYAGYVLPGVSRIVTQAQGTFSHFNALSALLALTTTIAFGYWLSSHSSVRRLGLFVLLAAGLVSTYSRGATLGAVAGCVLVFLGKDLQRRVGVILVSLLCVAISLLAVSGVVSSYFAQTGNLGMREALWREAFTAMRSDPSKVGIGFGYTYFQYRVSSSQTTSDPSAVGSPMHSAPLQVLLELGIIGEVLLIMILLKLVIPNLGGERGGLVLALAAGAVAFMIQQLADNNLFAYGGTLLFLVLGLLANTGIADNPAVARFWTPQAAFEDDSAPARDGEVAAVGPHPR